MEVTMYNSIDHATIEDIEKVLKEKLGEKYELKLKKKAGFAGKMVGGAQYDQITVIKNAYHRTVVSVNTIEDPMSASGNLTTIYFSEAEVAGWLSFLRKEVGFIGSAIIGLIYGKSTIYDDVKDTIKDNMNIKVETHNVGLSALFKKKKKTEE